MMRPRGVRNVFAMTAWVGLLWVAGCSSAGSSGTTAPRETGGGLSDQLDANVGAHRAAVERREALARGREGVPPTWRDTIDRCWAVWQLRPQDVDPNLGRGGVDPGRLAAARAEINVAWGQAKDEWLALGPGAENILVENLLAWYVRAYDSNAGYEVDRAKAELAALRNTAIPYVVTALAQTQGDNVVRNRLSDLLMAFGEASLPEIERVWGDADEKGRRELVKAVKLMRSPEAIPFLDRLAGDEGQPFEIRIEAIDGLGRLAAKSSAPTLRRCLRDRDPSVRKFAAMNLPPVSDGRMADKVALVSAMRVALDDQDRGSAEACRGALMRLTGLRLPLDPEAWNRELARSGGE